MAFPFLEHLEKYAVDTHKLLESLLIDGNSRTDFQYLMSNKAFYTIAEQASILLNDPYCGVNLGTSVNLANIPILYEAFATNIRLDAMLINFIQVQRKYSTSSHFALNVGQHFTMFQQIRTVQPSFPVAQADAFQVGLLLQLLYATSGNFLGGAARVYVTTSAPDACILPPQYLGVNVIRSNHGISLSFPTPWLARKVQGFGDAESSLPLLKGEARRGWLVKKVNLNENLTAIPKKYIESFCASKLCIA